MPRKLQRLPVLPPGMHPRPRRYQRNSVVSRLDDLRRYVVSLIIFVLLPLLCPGSDNSVAAAKLAHEARQAQNAGQLVRAYMLFAEAAARDSHNPTYRANRDALEPAAKLLSKGQISGSNIETEKLDPKEVKRIAENGSVKETNAVIPDTGEAGDDLPIEALPHIHPVKDAATFELRTDGRTMFSQIAAAYGIGVIFDPDFKPDSNLKLSLSEVNLETALDAATSATHTFVFPVSNRTLLVVPDTEAKRNEVEPRVLVTVPIPNSLDQRDIVEAANAIRILLSMQAIGWTTGTHQVVIRDRYSKARVAKLLLEAVMLPRAQVAIEVQILTLNTDKSYHYGLSLPTSFTVLDFGRLGGFNTKLPSLSSSMTFLAFATLKGSPFGFALTNATIFGTYSESFAKTMYDATVVVGDSQTANFHIGDKYPIAQSLFTGYQSTGASLANPFGQVTMEDLGLILKIIPKVGGDGDVSLELEGSYKSLGTQTFDTVPTINQREFKGTVRLREDEWAVLGGIDEQTDSRTRTGLAGVSNIPGINQVLSENTRETQTEKTLIVVRPTIKRLPVSNAISPQFLLGSQHGSRVLL